MLIFLLLVLLAVRRNRSFSCICNVTSLKSVVKYGIKILLVHMKLLMVWLIGVGPLTRNGELLYQTFSIRFIAGRSLTVKAGYYADWIITERNVTALSDRHCSQCRNYCYHGYEYAAESCASSCECSADVNTGMCSAQLFVVLSLFTLLRLQFSDVIK